MLISRRSSKKLWLARKIPLPYNDHDEGIDIQQTVIRLVRDKSMLHLLVYYILKTLLIHLECIEIDIKVKPYIELSV